MVIMVNLVKRSLKNCKFYPALGFIHLLFRYFMLGFNSIAHEIFVNTNAHFASTKHWILQYIKIDEYTART